MNFANYDDDELENLGENLSTKSFLKQLQQQSEVRHQFSERITAIKSNQLDPGQTTPVLHIFPGNCISVHRGVMVNNLKVNDQNTLIGNNNVENYGDQRIETHLSAENVMKDVNDKCVKTDATDIQDEIDF